jgi:4-hydroxymandelate oxidase
VVKGVMRADDARECIDAGARAIYVSNHGGRICPDSVDTASAVADVVAGVDGRAEVYVDGGIRSGIDVLRALALGAHAVLVGRPVLWGLAVDGEAGVFAVLEALRVELVRTMAFCGVAHLGEVRNDLITLR